MESYTAPNSIAQQKTRVKYRYSGFVSGIEISVYIYFNISIAFIFDIVMRGRQSKSPLIDFGG